MAENEENIGRVACVRFHPSLVVISPIQLIATMPVANRLDSASLFSLEIPESVTRIDKGTFDFIYSDETFQCTSLRNVALPISCKVEEGTFQFCKSSYSSADLKQLPNCTNVFGESSERKIINALKLRFDNLPIHKMIYYQSYNNVTPDQLRIATESSKRRISRSGNWQDCLGMTPLHILVCSTVQDVQLYRVILEKYPGNLIAEDKWGAIPLLYAVWGNAPDEVMQFLVQSYQTLYPEYRINWAKMADTLIRASTSTKKLLAVHLSFTNQCIDWTHIHDKLQLGISGKLFLFLVHCCSDRRINAIGIKQWRKDMQKTKTLCYIKSSRGGAIGRRKFITMLQTKLVNLETKYHNVKECVSLLELALWKIKINEETGRKRKIDESDLRQQCRINCRADIVIEHMLPFLLPLGQKYSNDVAEWCL